MKPRFGTSTQSLADACQALGRITPAPRSDTTFAIKLLLGAILAVLIFQAFSSHNNAPTVAPSVAVPSPYPLAAAQTAAPRAQLVRFLLPETHGNWIVMPDNSQLYVTVRGILGNVSLLPRHGARIGDAYQVDDHLWVLTTTQGGHTAWVDP